MSTRRRSTTSEGTFTPFLETSEPEKTAVVEETPPVEEVEVEKEVVEVVEVEPEPPKLEPKPEKKEVVKTKPAKKIENPKPISPPELVRPRRNVPRFVR